ncbi:MAG: methionine--tRNA ligase [Candidatus Micrarchaeota archaeon]
MTKYLITSALPYVNNVPHLGNIIGCVLSADVFARYCRSVGHETLYVCGTDEYGTATEAKAIEEGVSPREICDKYHKLHKSIYEWFGISTDIFGRTSTEKHTKITQDIFLDLYQRNMLIEQEVEQPYDEKLGMFLADRFVIGTCPTCRSDNARSDQCDKCNRLLTYAELIEPKSKLSGVKPVLRKTRHLFLDLVKSQPLLKTWIDDVERQNLWSSNTIAIARSWLKEGLRARSITRDLKWGVPVPLPGWENKVLYVWFDAPIGYISISANFSDKYMDWWGGHDVQHYEFIGKDNVPFHAIIFPATLLGTGKKWTLPHYISSTEFLNYEDSKFSKSKGIGVFGDDAKNSGIPADVWRYYLLANRPETSDTSFSWDDFGLKANNELLANYGNLVNRTLVFCAQNFEGKVPAPVLSEADTEFLSSQKIRLLRVGELLEGVKIRQAVHEFMGAASAANAYFQAQAPWKVIHSDRSRAASAIYVFLHQIKDLAIAGEPFLPFTSEKIFSQLGIDKRGWPNIGQLDLPAGHALGTPEHLYKPLEKKFLDECKHKFSGKQSKGNEGKKQPPSPAGPKEKSSAAGVFASPATAPIDLGDLELEVGLIESVERHPNAEKLYVEKILLSEGEIRQVCSGLVQHVPADEMAGRSCILVKNLKSAKLRGVESQGMLLAAQDSEGKLEVLSPDAPAGTKVGFEGQNQSSAQSIDPISIDEFRTVEFEVRGGVVYANDKRLLVDGKPVQTSKVRDGKVS